MPAIEHVVAEDEAVADGEGRSEVDDGSGGGDVGEDQVGVG